MPLIEAHLSGDFLDRNDLSLWSSFLYRILSNGCATSRNPTKQTLLLPNIFFESLT